MMIGLEDNKSMCKRRKENNSKAEQNTISKKLETEPTKANIKNGKLPKSCAVDMEMIKYTIPLHLKENNSKIPLHKSLMDIKMHISDRDLLAQQRTMSCYLEPPSALGHDKRKFPADSFMGRSLSSLPELYRSAVLYDEAKPDHKTTSQAYQITKEVFTDLNFIVLSGNILLFCFGFSVLYTHVAAYAASIGLSITSRNTVFSALGISNILGRVLLGVIGNQLILFTL